MRRLLLAMGLAAFASAASAQTLYLFPIEQYGKAYMTMPQSSASVSTIQLQNILGRNANFERLDSYRAQDRFRKLAAPVGRLDLIQSGAGGFGVANCTATIISQRYILTNAHCFPEGANNITQGSLLMDFYTDERTARRFEIRIVPVERDRTLDYAIVEVIGNPGATYGTARLDPRDPEPAESLLIIHHPMGMPKHMTRGGCRAYSPTAIDGSDIYHRCDTLPGSSGSPILSDDTGRMIGLHYAGSPAPSAQTWNYGKRLAEIAKQSRVVREIVATQQQEDAIASRASASAIDGDRARRDADMRAEFERRLNEQVEAEVRARIAALPSTNSQDRNPPFELPPSSPTTSRNASDNVLCRLALNSEFNGWGLQPVQQQHLPEVRRRNLTIASCRVLLGMSANMSGITANGVICGSALNSTRNGWETQPVYSEYVDEVKRRGLTVEDCVAALGTTKNDTTSKQPIPVPGMRRIPIVQETKSAVRRQNIRDGLRPLLTEASAHLGLQSRRLLAGAASVGARWSFA